MGAKWLWGIIILAIASLLLSFIFGMPKIKGMENDISSALNTAGYSNANVEMHGNIAKLTGELPSEAAARDAVSIAESTECSVCKGKRKWHKVDNQLTYQTLPTQSPYTFSGVKDEAGNIVLSGYVPSDADKARILASANDTFAGNVVDRTIRVAAGQPDGEFVGVTETYMKELALLQKGRFSQEDYAGLISGEAASADVRSQINAMKDGLPGKYRSAFAANISVPDMAAENVGEVKSKSICQTLFDDLNQGQTIEFQTNRAEIRGAESFDLLNTLASAANQCASFRIAVDGHTDDVGDAKYNQALSEARANTVVAYLNKNDVAVSRMTATGYGESKPKAANDNEEGRAQNRRIEFTLTQAE